jgi:hypothetical protein
VVRGVAVSKIGDREVCGSEGGVEKVAPCETGGGVSTEFRPSVTSKREKFAFMEIIISLNLDISPWRVDRVEVVVAK